MRNTTRQTRENRTITVDFQHEATYVQLLSDGKAFVECVMAFLLSLGFQLKQIPSDLVVKSQAADSIDLILQLIGPLNGVHRPCRNRKSRGAVLSTSEGQWATTKFDGGCNFRVRLNPWLPMV